MGNQVRKPLVPVPILLTVASLSKKYMVNTVFSMTVQALKKRLATDNADMFEEILAGAIAHDIGAVRMAAMDAARNFSALRDRYESASLRPEVAFELEAIWPSPSGGI